MYVRGCHLSPLQGRARGVTLSVTSSVKRSGQSFLGVVVGDQDAQYPSGSQNMSIQSGSNPVSGDYSPLHGWLARGNIRRVLVIVMEGQLGKKGPPDRLISREAIIRETEVMLEMQNSQTTWRLLRPKASRLDHCPLFHPPTRTHIPHLIFPPSLQYAQ